MSNITFGKYVNRNTFIHRLDPRLKFLMLFLFMSVIFIDIGFTGYAILGVIIFSIYFIARLSFTMIFKSLKPVWFMMFILLIINCVIIKDGKPIDLKIFTIYTGALVSTFYIFLRITLLICCSSIFTATTKPMDITVAIEDLFGFLKVFHINVHILSMIISIALRFIPTILDETYKIMKAQASRGVDFTKGKIREKIVAISSLIIPLFISAFSRSDELANAMEARGYNPSAKRTRYKQIHWKYVDTLALLFGFIILGGFITLNVIYGDIDYLVKGWF